MDNKPPIEPPSAPPAKVQPADQRRFLGLFDPRSQTAQQIADEINRRIRRIREEMQREQ